MSRRTGRLPVPAHCGRNGGIAIAAGTGAPPARSCNWDIESGARKHGKVSAAHSPAVEKQQRLFPALQGLPHRLEQDRGDKPAPLAADACACRWSQDRGRAGSTVASCHPQILIPAPVGIDPAFNRGCGRGKNHRAVTELPAHHRHVPCIVEDTVFLLVGRIMLLIDDDESKILKRQEERRTRSRHDTDLACCHLPPQLFALFRRNVRMPFARLRSKAVFKPLQKTWPSGRFPAAGSAPACLVAALGHCLKIDFRLARACHTIQQRNREALQFATATLKASAATDLLFKQFRLFVMRVRQRNQRRPPEFPPAPSTSCLIKPLITEALVPAAWARPDFDQAMPSRASSRTRDVLRSSGLVHCRRNRYPIRRAEVPGRQALAAPCAGPCPAATRYNWQPSPQSASILPRPAGSRI